MSLIQSSNGSQADRNEFENESINHLADELMLKANESCSKLIQKVPGINFSSNEEMKLQDSYVH